MVFGQICAFLVNLSGSRVLPTSNNIFYQVGVSQKFLEMSASNHSQYPEGFQCNYQGSQPRKIQAI